MASVENCTSRVKYDADILRMPFAAGVEQAMAQLSTLRVVRSEALVCLEAMCAQKLTEKHFHRLMEHLPEMVLNVKQALAQASKFVFLNSVPLLGLQTPCFMVSCFFLSVAVFLGHEAFPTPHGAFAGDGSQPQASLTACKTVCVR